MLKFVKRYYVLILPLIIYLVLDFTGIINYYHFVPDYFKLSFINPQDFFGIIIGAIASIFGILMAVVLLTVEFSGDKHNDSPLDNELIKNSLYNSINIIAISLLSYIHFDTLNNPKNLTIGYLVLLYFLCYLYFLTPVIKVIIKNNSRIKQNLDLVENLTLNSFLNLNANRFENNAIIDESLKKLSAEIDLYILNNNLTSYKKLNIEILNKAIGLIEDGKNRNECDIICSALINIWKQNLKTASRTNDSYYYEIIWQLIGKLYQHFSDKRAPLLHLQDIHLFIYLEFISLHVRNGIAQPLASAVDILEKAFYANLYNNCPKEDELKHLNELYDKESGIIHSVVLEIQWDQIVDLGSSLNRIQEAAIDLNDKELFENTTREIESICSSFYWENSPLGIRQKSYLMSQLLTGSFYHSEIAIEKNLFDSTLNAFHIPKYLLEDVVKRKVVEEKDVRDIITNLTNHLINTYEKGKLFVDGYYGTLNEFCIIGIHLLKHYKVNPLAKKTVDYIINFLKYLKEDIEKKDLENEAVYSNVKSKLKHFINVAVDIDGFEVSTKPVSKWVKLLDDFKEVAEQKDFIKIKWK